MMYTALKLFVCILLGFFLPIAIWYFSEIPNTDNNGFNRSFIQNAAKQIDNASFSEKVEELVGFNGDTVFFSTKETNKLSFLTNNLTLFEKEVSFENYLQHDRKNPRIRKHLNSLFVFFDRKLLLLNDNKREYTFEDSYIYSMPTTEHSIIMQKINSSSDKVILKYNIDHRELKLCDAFFKLDDNGLISDGQLIVDKIDSLVGYTYYYHNTSLIFDSKMHLLKKIRTIDTVTKSNNSFLNESGVPLVTNQKSCLHKGFLFLSSNLKADNEQYKIYMKNVPIDIYNIFQGRYVGTFYIASPKGKLVKNMEFSKEGILHVLYHGGDFYRYEISFDLIV